MGLDPKPILDEIDAVLRDVDAEIQLALEEDEYPPTSAYEFVTKSSYRDVRYSAACTMAIAAIVRLAPRRSPYVQRAEVQTTGEKEIAELQGILAALRNDYERGRMTSQVELLHAETFADYLDMASHLLEEGYKDPGAVVAGSTLEAHLRALAAKLGVDPSQSDGKAKKTTVLVADLAKVQAFSKGDEKQILAWLDLRNLAAHGHGDKFQAPQVALFIDGLRDFMRRVPA